jgi:hypothetical protein
MSKKPFNVHVQDEDSVVWCITNGYKIYPITTDNTSYRVCVEYKEPYVFDDVYNKTTIHKAISDMYIRVYKQKSKKLL